MTIHQPIKLKCACVVGTRPEVIKMAPVIRELRRTDWATPVVVSSGQQDDLLVRALADFGLRSDHAIAYDARSGDIVPTLSSIASKLDALLDRIRRPPPTSPRRRPAFRRSPGPSC
jgi:UDP-N-acetylglucosamine 2-epimerase (non-hydrolysing)